MGKCNHVSPHTGNTTYNDGSFASLSCDYVLCSSTRMQHFLHPLRTMLLPSRTMFLFHCLAFQLRSRETLPTHPFLTTIEISNKHVSISIFFFLVGPVIITNPGSSCYLTCLQFTEINSSIHIYIYT